MKTHETPLLLLYYTALCLKYRTEVGRPFWVVAPPKRSEGFGMRELLLGYKVIKRPLPSENKKPCLKTPQYPFLKF